MLHIEPILPAQRAELEPVYLAYEQELEPGAAQPADRFERLTQAWFSDPDRWLWWAVNARGERVGFAILRRYRHWLHESQWIGSIAEFTIFPAHRQQGYGAALARLALETLKAAGCRQVEANVIWQRKESFEFWKAAGFKPDSILTVFDLSEQRL